MEPGRMGGEVGGAGWRHSLSGQSSAHPAPGRTQAFRSPRPPPPRPAEEACLQGASPGQADSVCVCGGLERKRGEGGASRTGQVEGRKLQESRVRG